MESVPVSELTQLFGFFFHISFDFRGVVHLCFNYTFSYCIFRSTNDDDTNSVYSKPFTMNVFLTVTAAQQIASNENV